MGPLHLSPGVKPVGAVARIPKTVLGGLAAEIPTEKMERCSGFQRPLSFTTLAHRLHPRHPRGPLLHGSPRRRWADVVFRPNGVAARKRGRPRNRGFGTLDVTKGPEPHGPAARSKTACSTWFRGPRAVAAPPPFRGAPGWAQTSDLGVGNLTTGQRNGWSAQHGSKENRPESNTAVGGESGPTCPAAARKVASRNNK